MGMGNNGADSTGLDVSVGLVLGFLAGISTIVRAMSFSTDRYLVLRLVMLVVRCGLLVER